VKKNFGLFFFTVILTGCAPILENMPGFSHSAALILGSEQGQVIQNAEHVLGESIKIESMSNGDDEFNLRHYAYTEKYNIVLVFYQGSFYQLFVEKKKPDDLPFIGHASDGLRGYILTKQGSGVGIQILGSSGAQLSPEMLTLTTLDIAWMKFWDKEYDQARKVALMVNQQYPNNTSAINILGNIDIREDKLESAINRFKEALQIIERGDSDERKDRFLNNLGMIYFKDKQFDNAHKIFEESISAASDKNCAGRLGNMLALISVDKEMEARKTVEPCVDSKRATKRSLETLNNLYDFVEMKDESLKKKAISVLEQISAEEKIK